MLRSIGFLISIFFIPLTVAATALPPAITTPLSVSQIANFESYSPVLKQLILKAQHLTAMNLTYKYGSADPRNKGMDCSGTIHYLLSDAALKEVPRQSDEMFVWVEKKGKLHRVSKQDFNSPEFSHLKPGDLLFWSGTYKVNRALFITHVMLYLGKDKDGKRIMFGASDGRTYKGKKMWGVSLFDFNLPDGKGPQRFVGYGCIPNLTCEKPLNP